MSFKWTPWNFETSPSSLLSKKSLNVFEVSSSSFSLPCKCRANALNKERLPLYGWLVFLSKVRQLTLQFLKSGSGKTVFLQPMGTSLSNEAKMDKNCKFVIFPLCIGSFSSTKMNNIQFLHSVFQVSHISLCTHKFSSFHNSIVLVSVKVSTQSILNIFQNESKHKINFCSTFQFFEYIIQFIVDQRHVEGWHGKVENSVSSILPFSICQKVFARFQFLSQTLIVNFSHYVLHINIARSESNLCSMLSIFMLT